MKHIKTFENINPGWVIDINTIVDTDILNRLPDIRDKVKEGDTVIAMWFGGDFDITLIKLEQLDDDMLGACDDETCYELEYAFGVYSLEEYKKKDPYFETRLKSIKYNL